jgi:predicted house-cleaning NTP pyrophosphatase (Maf/HAM1 superfamily)
LACWLATGFLAELYVSIILSKQPATSLHSLKLVHKNNDDGNEFELLSSFTVTAKVKFAQLSEQDIHAYVKTGEPMDKVGSYGIQGIGGQMIECMEGDFFAV